MSGSLAPTMNTPVGLSLRPKMVTALRTEGHSELKPFRNRLLLTKIDLAMLAPEAKEFGHAR